MAISPQETALLLAVNTNTLTPSILSAWAAVADPQTFSGATTLSTGVASLAPLRFAALQYDLLMNSASDAVQGYATIGELWGQLQPLATLRIAAQAGFQAAYDNRFTLAEFNAMRDALLPLSGKTVSGHLVTQTDLNNAAALSATMVSLPQNRLTVLADYLTTKAKTASSTMDVWNELVTLSQANTSSPVFTSGAAGLVNENALIATTIYTAVTTDGDIYAPHTYTLTGTDASLLNIHPTSGVVTLKASADYETKSSYSFNVVASDGNAAHNATRSVVVSVNNLNDIAPLFTSGDTGSVNENAATSTLIYTAATTDADNLGARTYSLTGTDAALLNINAATGAVTLKASADFEAKPSYNFNVVASDGVNTTTQPVVVSVKNLNDNPLSAVTDANATGNSVAENAGIGDPVGITALAADGDSGTTVSYSLTDSANGKFAINSTTGVITVAGTLDYETAFIHNVIVSASSSDGSPNTTKLFTINVTNVNDTAPVFTSGSTGSVDENALITTVVYTAATTDVDGGARTYTLGGVDKDSFAINAGVVTLKASADYEAKKSYSFDVIANDGINSTTQAVVVSVNNLPDTPLNFTSGGTASVVESAATTSIIYTAVAPAVPGASAPTYAITGGTDAAAFTIDPVSGAVKLNASADYETKASYSFMVTATDNATPAPNTADQLVAVSVVNLNDNTSLFTSGATGSVNENAPTTTAIYTAATTDADGGARTYTLSGTDAALLDITSAGVVTLKAPADYESTKKSYTFTVIAHDNLVSDSTDNPVSQLVTVSVLNTNDSAPLFTSGATGVVDEGAATTTAIYTAATTDADNLAARTYTLGGADAGLLDINASTGVVTLKASADYESGKTSYSFNVIANDGTNSTTQPVVVLVKNLNDTAPVFTSSAAGSVKENVAASTMVYLATTTDADNLAARTYALGGTDAGSLDINATTGVVTLKVSADYEAKPTYSFDVIASDGGNSATKAVVVSVVNVNDNAPVFTSGGTGTVNEHAVVTTVIYSAATSDADQLGAAPTYTLSGTDAKYLDINATTGVVTLKADADYEVKSSYSFNVIANDGTFTSVKPVLVSVVNMNDNTSLFTSGSTGSVNENAATTTAIYTAATTDADGGTRSYTLEGTDAGFLDINATTGVVTLKASADYETKGGYSFTVVAHDPLAADASDHKAAQNVVVSVVNLNDNPVSTITDSDIASNSVAENAVSGTVVGVIALATDADKGATVIYSLTDNAGGKFAINSATGVITAIGAIDYETAPSHNVTVLATSSDGSTNSQLFTINVTNVNDNSPVFTSGATAAVDENVAADTVIYTASTTDTDNLAQPLYSLGNGGDAALLTINATTGAVTLRNSLSPNFEAKTSYSFDVIANDGANNTTQSVVVSVNNLSEPGNLEITSGGTGSVNENDSSSPVVYTAAATPPNGGTVTFSLESGKDSGLFVLAGNVITLNATANYESVKSYSFDLKATDQNNNSAIQPVVISVVNLNDNASLFTSGATGSVNENAPTTTAIYTAVTTDADGGARTYTLSGADAALLDITSAGVVTLKTSADYESAKKTYSFTVVAHDNLVAGGSENPASQAVVVSVVNQNDNAPVFTSGGSGSVQENAAIATAIYTASTTDADNLAARTYTLGGADAGLLDITSTGVVTLKTSADYESPKKSYSFDVIASDGANIATQAVAVSVVNVNDIAPVFTSGTTASVDENAATTTVIYTAATTDADNLPGSATTYTLGGTDAKYFDINAGVVTLKAQPNYELQSTYRFNVLASDGVNTTAQALVVTVKNLNDNTPVFTSGATGTVLENAALSTAIYTAATTDADGGARTYELSGGDSALLNIDSNTGVVTLKASADYETKTSYSFTVIAHDTLVAGGTDNPVSQAVVVTVKNLNDNAPIFTSGSTVSVDEHSPVNTPVYTSVTTDGDNPTAAPTFTLGGVDASLFNITTAGVVTLKASAVYEEKSSYSFQVNANDGVATTSKAVMLLINNLNDTPPVFTSGGSGSVDENAAISAVVYTATTTDVDNLAPATYSLSGGDSALFTITSSGLVTLKASADYETRSSYSLNVVANDGANTTTQAVVVLVNNMNDLPLEFTSGATGSIQESVASGSAVYTATTISNNPGAPTFTLGGVDASLFNITTAGVVTLNSVPDYEAKPSYNISVRATLGTNTTNQDVVVSVVNMNDNTSLFTSGGTGSVNENAPITTAIYTAATTDLDGGARTYTLDGTHVALLDINANTGVVTLKNSADYETQTSYSFTVVAHDKLAADTLDHGVRQDVVVNVVNLNDNAPVFTSGATQLVNENVDANTVIYTALATDLENITYSLSGTDVDLLSINGNTGAVTLKNSARPDYEANVSYKFNVVADDGTFKTSKSVVVTVTNLNDNVPVFTSASTTSVAENTANASVVCTVLAADADPATTITYALTDNAGGRFAINAATGIITVADSRNLDYEDVTSHNVTVLATSTDSSSNSQVVKINLTNVNEFSPVFSSGGTGSVNENAAISTVIYTAVAVDDDKAAPTYTLSGADAGLLTINASTGAVTLKATADYEAKGSYSFSVVASDGEVARNATKDVVVSVNNLNDNSPVFTSGATGSVEEGAATTTAVYTSVTTDADGGARTYTLSGADAALLDITAAGVVTLKASANYEARSSYSFNVIAHDPLTPGDVDKQAAQAVVVSVVNRNDNISIFTSGTTGSVIENAATVTAIYTAVTTDADGGARSYTLEGTDAGLLDINSATGVVTLKTSANYESKQSYSFTVVAHDPLAADASDHKVSQNVVVSVVNLNDNPVSAITDSDIASNSVAENAVSGTVAGVTALATDADTGATVTYSLTDNAGGKFAINSATGVITAIGALDYEAATSHNVTVLAKSSDGSTNSQLFTINVTNLNDNAPMFTSGATALVDENVPSNTVIYTASTTDADNLDQRSYSLGNGGDAALLTINTTTGAVTLLNSVSPNFEAKTSYSFDVLANDGTNNTTQSVVVSVNNLVESGNVEFTSGGTASVNENGGTNQLVYTAVANSPTSGEAVTYRISGTDAALFTLDTATGAVRLNVAADYDVRKSYSFNITATDASNRTTVQPQTVVVSVGNLNDNTPVFTSGATGLVTENAPTTTAIYSAVTSDLDGGTRTYTLSGADAALLDITSAGVVTLKASADYESARKTYSFTVVAHDNLVAGGAENPASQAVVVSVVNQNDSAPVFTSGTTGTVQENAAITVAIYTASTTDADNLVARTYTLGGVDGGLLDITSTGVVTLKASADYESLKKSYNFDVIASDGANTTTQTVVVSVVNVNDVAPVFTSGTTASVNENAATSTVVYAATTTDADNLAARTYTLGGVDAGLLDITSTGVVTLKASADYESLKKSYNFDVIAFDGANTTTQAVVVSVNNMNDAPTGSVTIAGTPLQGETLTASHTLVDQDTLGTISYQWKAGGVEIAGATGSTLVLGEAQVNKAITVVASYTDGKGNAESVSSVATIGVVNIDDPHGGSVTIVGSEIQGSTLVVEHTLSDPDGIGAISYQWYADNIAIGNAVEQLYTLTKNEVGKSITVKAGYMDGHGTATEVSSAATAQVFGTNSGSIMDGYLDNALVWVDTDDDGALDWNDKNSDGKWNLAEGESWTYTDKTGQFNGLVGSGTIRITANPIGSSTNSLGYDTLDISTGKPFTGSYSAPSGYKVVTPLTTLVVAAGGDENLVKTALGLDPNLELSSYDPVAAASNVSADSDAAALAIKVQSATIQIANIIDIAASVAEGAGGSTAGIADSVANSLMVAAAASAGKTVDLADTSVISQSITAGVQDVVTDPTKLTNIASNIDEVAGAASLVNSNIEAVSNQAALDAQSLGTVDVAGSLTNIVSAQLVGQQTASEASNASDSPDNAALMTLTPDNIDDKVAAETGNVLQITVNHAPMGAIVIVGTPSPGEILTATNTIGDVDGFNAAGLSYQWFADGNEISNATNAIFTLAAAQIGQAVTVTASYIDGLDKTETVTSAATGAVPNVPTSLSTVIVALKSSSDTGTFNDDRLINETTPTVTVDLTGKEVLAGELVEIVDSNHGNAVVGSYTVTATDALSGMATLDIELDIPLVDDPHALVVQLTRLIVTIQNLGSGVTSGLASRTATTVMVDTLPPTTTVTDVHIRPDTGTSSTDFITNTPEQTVTGTLSAALAAGEVVYGSVNDGTTWVDITGKVSGMAISWDGVTLSGSNTIKIEVRDAAGNAGPAASHAYVLDTTAPSVTEVMDTTSAPVTNQPISFTVTFDEAVTGVGTGSFTATNGIVSSVTPVTGSNAYTVQVTLTSGVATGTVALSLVGTGLTDTAGNSVLSADLSLKDSQDIDTQAPTTTVKWVDLDTVVLQITGTLTTATVTGEVVKVKVNNGLSQNAVNTPGATGFTLSGLTLTGNDTLQVWVEDANGNAGTIFSDVMKSVTGTGTGTSTDLPGTAITALLPAGLVVDTHQNTSITTGLLDTLSALDGNIGTDNTWKEGISAYATTVGVAPIIARSVDFVTNAAYTDPVTINGTAADHEALVIDTTNLLDGTTLNLNEVDFAILTGTTPSGFKVRGGAGDNIVFAGAGNQDIELGAGKDELHGGAGNDTIASLAGNDTLWGEAGNDSISGGAENDTLIGGAGNDTLDGGSGDDTAVFSGNRALYTIGAFNAATQSYTVTGPDGTDTITNIEYLKFTDQTYTIADPFANVSAHHDSDGLLVGLGALGLLAWLMV